MKIIRKKNRPKPKPFNDKKLYTVSRWLALINAVDIIFSRADRLQIEESKVDLSPNDIQDYIDDISGDIYHKLNGTNYGLRLREYAAKL
jgi:glutathionyl-hydroquinone reductase